MNVKSTQANCTQLGGQIQRERKNSKYCMLCLCEVICDKYRMVSNTRIWSLHGHGVYGDSWISRNVHVIFYWQFQAHWQFLLQVYNAQGLWSASNIGHHILAVLYSLYINRSILLLLLHDRQRHRFEPKHKTAYSILAFITLSDLINAKPRKNSRFRFLFITGSKMRV